MFRTHFTKKKKKKGIQTWFVSLETFLTFEVRQLLLSTVQSGVRFHHIKLNILVV